MHDTCNRASRGWKSRLVIAAAGASLLLPPALAEGPHVRAASDHVRAASDHVRARAAEFGLKNPDRELKMRKAEHDGTGVAHVRFDQYYEGVPVIEGEMICRVDPDGGVTVTSAIRGGLHLSVVPTLTSEEALAAAFATLKIRTPVRSPAASLAILPRGERSPVDVLVWRVEIDLDDQAGEPAFWNLFVDARSGIVVWAFDALERSASSGTGRTMYAGNVTLDVEYSPIPLDPNHIIPRWALRDPTRGGNYTTDMYNSASNVSLGSLLGVLYSPVLGNNLKNSSDRVTAGADAHYGVQKAWDYFKLRHNRNGWDGAGAPMLARVHFGNNFEGSYWHPSAKHLTFGDGGASKYPLVSLDVVAHEYAHAVMQATAKLTYDGESGALNEANSDIFATMVEYFVNSSVDTPDYWIGERVRKGNWFHINGTQVYLQFQADRYMDDPAKGGQPACWYAGIGNLAEHVASGPANHMFYLLAEGGESKCNSHKVTGIGRMAAAKIWYKAVSEHMTSGTNYSQAREACLQSAADLYGRSSVQATAVASAFGAINVF